MVVQFYCLWSCPFAQRAWVSLLEKEVDFNYNEIDPYNKTKEFLAINPRGLVPVIVEDGKCVYESSVCIEYADERWKGQGQTLLPVDPYERARVRIWSDFISKKIVPSFYQLLKRKTEEEREEGRRLLLDSLETFSAEISDEGPYFLGKEFGMVDIMLLSFAYRLDVLKHYRNFELPDSENMKKLKKWMSAVLNRESVKKTLPPIEKLIEKHNYVLEETTNK